MSFDQIAPIASNLSIIVTDLAAERPQSTKLTEQQGNKNHVNSSTVAEGLF